MTPQDICAGKAAWPILYQAAATGEPSESASRTQAWDLYPRADQCTGRKEGVSVPCVLLLFVRLASESHPASEKYADDATAMTP